MSGPIDRFVRKMCIEGRTEKQIMAVARSTQWASRIDEIRRVLGEKGEEWRKIKKSDDIVDGDAIVVAHVLNDSVSDGQIKETTMERKALNSLLVKLGVDADVASKLSGDRAQVKAKKRLGNLGVPEGLTEAEKAVVAELTGATVAAEAEAPATEAKAEPKAKAKTTKAAEPKAEAPAAKPAEKKASRPRTEGARAIFREAFKSRKTWDREELVAMVMEKTGCGKSTPVTYIADSKGDKSPFEFRLREDVSKAGKKTLVRIEK